MDKNTLKECIQQNPLFQHLPYDSIENLSRSADIKSYQANQIIITEGDLGDVLYLIMEGEVRVYTKNNEAKEIVLARLEKNHYFGEQALLSAIPIRRNASVKAITNVKVAVISHADFQQALQKDQDILKNLLQKGYTQLIDNLSKKLSEQENQQKELYQLFNHIQTFSAQTIFFQQGDQPDNAYYLLSGLIEIQFHDEKSQIKTTTHIHPGQFFGEKGIIEHKTRAGTAIAMTTCQVAIIQKTALLEAYQKNVGLQKLLNSYFKLYAIPHLGLITQYQGEFLNQPAIYTNTHKKNGEVIIAARVINADIFAVRYANESLTERKKFQDTDFHQRELQIQNGYLIAVLSIGEWDDLKEITQAVHDKLFLDSTTLRHFSTTGRLYPIQPDSIAVDKNICICMQVKISAVMELISKEMTTIDDISHMTGAGTVCGGCRPNVITLLGGSVWTFANLVAVKEHTKEIRSYQITPIKKSIFPYQAGQHIVISVYIDNHWIDRSYTISDCDEKNNYYEITVKKENLGLLSSWLFNHDKTSFLLKISKPQGEFILDTQKNNPALFFAGGIGITPAIALAKKIINEHSARHLHIDYSIHEESQLIFKDEIEAWQAQPDYISVTIHYTQKEGRIKKDGIHATINQYPEADIYICGPKDYQNFLTNLCLELGISNQRIYIEEFKNAFG